MNTTAKYHQIMIVDDNYIDRYVVESCLKKLQICDEVISMETAVEALHYLQQHADDLSQIPEIILLDIRMPGMDGFEFLEVFETLPETLRQHCDVVMLSSTIYPNDLERIKHHPVVKRFLNKPFGKDAALSL
ncbi:MAG: response regulator [Thermoflavifilum sp.]|nr:response regulator [Thermoflavifilum sp.]